MKCKFFRGGRLRPRLALLSPESAGGFGDETLNGFAQKIFVGGVSDADFALHISNLYKD
jgi:hypothetical protein